MRPFTLRGIYEFLNLLRSGGSIGGDRRLREFLRASLDLGFVSEVNGTYVITERGSRFMSAMEVGDATTIHALLMDSLESYRRVYELVSRGVTKPSELIRLTGYNAVVIDIVMRLIREVEALSPGSPLSKDLYARFEEVLLSKYRELSRRRWSRYVPITELVREVRNELNIPNRVVNAFLEEFIRRMGSKVVLTGAPGKGGRGSMEINGRRFTYIMIGD
ncbi:hypothetical protein [Vulcanisaeta distributa]|uniref:Uncharacterized protein n=1 Tax=Vulcanisaeta distributa (strain DSM 14429 / JCM 11212 / NBRC 100878 / IC-017) TaxID=572478 RepID=E1QST0_VULDI|nr:hypothetical protein [Vulcanisaeta distributa]ADN49597.1 hypothetical protein Vdis_0184 [Vulcanisaeta distributa DSM 14429]